ncbi:MAG: DJ-1/PfpI family protein [Planctomycetes bacterium]|nr:DJ-1/PfpI family protein [Planctomycetota bacterium]
MSDVKKAVLIIAREIFRDEELFDTQKALEAAHVKTTVASSVLGNCKGKLGAVAVSTMKLEEIIVDQFDAIVFIGGGGAAEYYDNQVALKLAKDAMTQGKVLAAICIAPRILANAGLLEGITATCFESEAENIKKLGANYTGADLEQDGNIITASGPHAATEFGETIAEAIPE